MESVMVTSAIPKDKPTNPAASVLICDARHMDLGETTSRSLQNLTGLLAPVKDLLGVDLNDKYGIVLAMGESMLFNLDETGFRRIQVLFSTVRGILWVSRGAGS